MGVWTIVDSGVNDSAVVTGLMASQFRFLFYNGDAPIRNPFLLKLHGGGEADNAAADNNYVVFFRFHGLPPPRILPAIFPAIFPSFLSALIPVLRPLDRITKPD